MDERSRANLLRVVGSGNCSGCGGCAAAFSNVSMGMDPEGFLRPRFGTSGELIPTDPEGPRFEDFCPGHALSAPRSPDAPRNPLVGTYVAAWRGWAADADLRHRGSSGGVLTAIAQWLLAEGEGARVVAARAAVSDPRLTEWAVVDEARDMSEFAGSRYAPVGVAAAAEAYDPTSVVIAKPCEASAIRRRTRGGDKRPLLLSFFCAGTPSQFATDELLRAMGLDSARPLKSLRYRGLGWPGRFAAVDADGHEASESYELSWGTHLGRALQWRCKICADGVGEDADIVAADYWAADANGYPRFDEADGVSAVIARTARGASVVRAAAAAGVITVEPVDPRGIAARQPYQVRRRVTLLARLIGAKLAGRTVPRYRGYGLLRLTLRDPARAALDGWGSFTRALRARSNARGSRDGV